jgi:hypothetical protein
METPRTDDELAAWMNSTEYQRRAEIVDVRAAHGHVMPIDEMSEFLDVPLDLLKGLIAKELWPERFQEFVRRRRVQ